MAPKSYLFLIAGTLLTFSINAQIDVQWVGRYSTAGNNIDRAKAMVVDTTTGNSFVVGTSWNGTNFDIVTEKFDQNGVTTWTGTYNGTGNSYDEGRAITFDAAGNVYVTGYSAGASSNYDIVTIKYNSAGSQQWATRFDGSAAGFDESYDIMADASGNVYVTGGTTTTTTGNNYITIKYNSAGVQQWATVYSNNNANTECAYAMAMDGSGNVYVTGTSFGSAANDNDIATIKYNNSGVQQWVMRHNGAGSNFDAAADIALDASGNVYVCGYDRGALSVTDYDAVLIKYNNGGIQQWVKTYNGPGNDYDRANMVTILPNGNPAITGRSLGTTTTAEDMLTIVYDAATGNPVWTRRYDGGINNYDDGQAIVADSSNRIFVTGYSYGTGQNNNFFTIKYDANGDTSWYVKYNGPGNNADQAYSIAMGITGEFYVGGMSKGSGTNEDYAVVKYCQLSAIVSPDTTICLGAQTTLSGASSYGAIDSIWWTPTTFLNQSNIANPVASPTVTTTYTLHVRNQYGCVDLDTVTVTVTPLPGPVITSSGPTSFCIGGSVTLTADDTTSTNETYLWSNNATTSSITVNTSGTYSCTITNGTGCSSLSSQTVTVNNLPTISTGNDFFMCQSTQTQMCATGGVSYAWSPNFGISDTTVACPMFGPTSSTTYIVYGTDANGCVNSDTITIGLYPPPSIPVITRNIAVLSCTSASTYQWYLNGNPINGATSQNYTPTQNGNYYVVITDANGCSATSAVYNMNDVSVQQIEANDGLTLYPNPNHGVFTVSFDQRGLNASLIITDIAGQTIMKKDLAASSAFNHELSLDVPAGVYFLNVNFEDGTKLIRRIVIN
ncbi:MAG TPA: T9SS type A sorting domain-containing protein [Bacteroidia bacterium]|nr:T9SS type A sorting domain-containing protein [Bacteroidia bacterium]